MSIISSCIADINNEIKDKWVKNLKDAFDKKDWELMELVIKEIDDYYFSE